MTFAASVLLPEAVARETADRIGEDVRLPEVGIDLIETTPGQWRLTLYFEDMPDAGQADALAGALRESGNTTARFAFEVLPDTDWVAKSLAGLSPVRAGRFLVHGAHDRKTAGPNDLGIEIEAGQAFGTGHHGTTTGCLLAIDALARSQRFANALDIGTGSGVLAIAIAKRTNARVLASDIDPVAVAVARDNVRLNGVAARVRTIVANGLDSRLIGTRAPFDLIVANILAGPLVRLAPAIRRAAASGGALILSGLLTNQERRVAAIYRAQGFTRPRRITLGEWVTLIFGA